MAQASAEKRSHGSPCKRKCNLHLKYYGDTTCKSQIIPCGNAVAECERNGNCTIACKQNITIPDTRASCWVLLILNRQILLLPYLVIKSLLHDSIRSRGLLLLLRWWRHWKILLLILLLHLVPLLLLLLQWNCWVVHCSPVLGSDVGEGSGVVFLKSTDWLPSASGLGDP